MGDHIIINLKISQYYERHIIVNKYANKSNIFLMVISALEKDKAEDGTRKY